MTNLVKKASITAAAAAAILSASYAFAADYFVEYVYYSDSSRTTVVGQRIEQCGGGVYITGTVTAYKREMHRELCFPGGELN